MKTLKEIIIEQALELTEAKVNHSAYESSHGKKASGKGSWAFGKERNPKIDDVFFSSPNQTLSAAAKEAAKHFGVKEVFVQP